MFKNGAISQNFVIFMEKLNPLFGIFKTFIYDMKMNLRPRKEVWSLLTEK